MQVERNIKILMLPEFIDMLQKKMNIPIYSGSCEHGTVYRR